MEKKTKTTLSAGAIIGLLLIYIINSYIRDKPEKFDKELMQASNEFNKQLPYMVDKETMAVTTTGGPGNRFTFFVELINIEKKYFRATGLNKLKNYLRVKVTNSIKSTPEIRELSNRGVVIVYNYKDKNHIFLFEIIVKPEDEIQKQNIPIISWDEILESQYNNKLQEFEKTIELINNNLDKKRKLDSLKYWKNKDLSSQIGFTMGRLSSRYLPYEKRNKLMNLLLKIVKKKQQKKKPSSEDLQLFKSLLNDTKKLCQTSYERDFLDNLINYWW
jgi:hypothetical protein